SRYPVIMRFGPLHWLTSVRQDARATARSPVYAGRPVRAVFFCGWSITMRLHLRRRAWRGTDTGTGDVSAPGAQRLDTGVGHIPCPEDFGQVELLGRGAERTFGCCAVFAAQFFRQWFFV